MRRNVCASVEGRENVAGGSDRQIAQTDDVEAEDEQQSSRNEKAGETPGPRTK